MGWRLLNSLTSSRSSYLFNYEVIFKRIYTCSYPLANLSLVYFWCFRSCLVFWYSGLIISFPNPGGKSSVDARFSWDYIRSWTDPYVASGFHMPSILFSHVLYAIRFSYAINPILSCITCIDVIAWSMLDFFQGVDHFKKIQYADGITYGELFLENELVNKLRFFPFLDNWWLLCMTHQYMKHIPFTSTVMACKYRTLTLYHTHHSALY